MDGFSFPLAHEVTLVESGEMGVVTGRGQYMRSENTYLVRYKNAQGVQVEQWWGESALKDTERGTEALV